MSVHEVSYTKSPSVYGLFVYDTSKLSCYHL